MRILCLFFPRLGIQFVHRSRPELQGRPLVLVGNHRGMPVVTEASTEAADAGVVRGMTPTQARGRCANAVFLPDNAGECLEELERIASIVYARATTPVAIEARGELLIDAERFPGHLGLDEAECASRMATLVRMWTGFNVRAGVASSRCGARQAARAARLGPAIQRPMLNWDESPIRFRPPERLRVEVSVPAAASPLAVRARLHQAAARLEVILNARRESFRELRLTIGSFEEDPASVRRAVAPSSDVTGTLAALGAWLTDERLASAASVAIEADRLGPDLEVRPGVGEATGPGRHEILLRAAG